MRDLALRIKWAGVNRFYAPFWIGWAVVVLGTVTSSFYGPPYWRWFLSFLVAMMGWLISLPMMLKKNEWGHPEKPPRLVVLAFFSGFSLIFFSIFRFLL